jgi:hypothetical protein
MFLKKIYPNIRLFPVDHDFCLSLPAFRQVVVEKFIAQTVQLSEFRLPKQKMFKVING